jgi:hypothetical protein
VALSISARILPRQRTCPQRSRPPCRRAAGPRPIVPSHHPAHDPCVLADLPPASESEVLEEFDGRAEQETARRLAAGGHPGDGLDKAAASLRSTSSAKASHAEASRGRTVHDIAGSFPRSGIPHCTPLTSQIIASEHGRTDDGTSPAITGTRPSTISGCTPCRSSRQVAPPPIRKRGLLTIAAPTGRLITEPAPAGIRS